MCVMQYEALNCSRLEEEKENKEERDEGECSSGTLERALNSRRARAH